MNDEDIKLLKSIVKVHNTFLKGCKKETITAREIQAIENLLNRYQQYEEKLMFALSPTNHELALETQRNFKKIIMQNIDKDTYTIRKELKKYLDNMNTYWEGK